MVTATASLGVVRFFASWAPNSMASVIAPMLALVSAMVACERLHLADLGLAEQRENATISRQSTVIVKPNISAVSGLRFRISWKNIDSAKARVSSTREQGSETDDRGSCRGSGTDPAMLGRRLEFGLRGVTDLTHHVGNGGLQYLDVISDSRTIGHCRSLLVLAVVLRTSAASTSLCCPCQRGLANPRNGSHSCYRLVRLLPGRSHSM